MDSKQKTKILVAAHSQRFREKLRAVLEQQEDLQLTAEAEHDLQLAAMLKAMPVDILVLDEELPRSGAMHALHALRHQPQPRVLLTGGSFSEDCVTEALLQGVRGFLPRGCCPQHWVKAIGVICAGDVWLGRKTLLQAFTGLHQRSHKVNSSPSLASLTPREREVSHGIAEGLTNKEIARQLGISDKTIKAHLSHVFAKLGVTRRIQVVLPPGRPRAEG